MRNLAFVCLGVFALVLLASCASTQGAATTPTPTRAEPTPSPPPQPTATSYATEPRQIGGVAATVSPTPIPIYHPPPYTVAIEAGHGGPYYFGASARDSEGNRWIEKDVALDIALLLREKLVALGYSVVMVRDGDYTLTTFDPAAYRPSLIAESQARVDMANAARADALVSVHLNGWGDASQEGTETYCNPDRSFGDESCGLAWWVQDALVRWIHNNAYDSKDRGVKNDSLVNGDPANPHSFMLGTNVDFRPSFMPGVIVESLFLSNPDDLEFLRRTDGIEIIASAIAEGVDSYFKWLNPQ